MPTTTMQGEPRLGGGDASWYPLLRPIAVATLALLLVLDSGAVSYINGLNIPNTVPLLLGIGAIGLAVILPRSERVIIPIAPTLLVILLLLSIGWTHDPNFAGLWLRTNAIMMLGIVSLSLVLTNRDVVAAFKMFVAFVLAVTLAAVVVDPLARTHIDPTGEAPELPGWHGWFIHKNTMAGFMVVALATVMAFYRSRAARWMAFIAIVVLMAGSDSTTGRSALVVQIAVGIWFGVNRRLTSRGSAAFAVSTVAVVLVAAAAIASSLATIARVAGKDLTFTGRTKIWAAVLDEIAGEPIIGHGVKGLFGMPRTTETMTLLRHIGFPAGHSHNGLLDVGVQLGIVGIVLVVWQFVELFRISLREMARSRRAPQFGLTVAAGICVMSVGESSFLDSNVAIVFVTHVLLLRNARSNRRSIAQRRGSARVEFAR